MHFDFPIIIIDKDYRSENSGGLGVRALAKAIEKKGFDVFGVTSYGDMTSFAQQQSRASAFILSIDDEDFRHGRAEESIAGLRAFVNEIRRRNEDIPIFLYGETRTSRHIPNDVLRELHGFIHMFEDTAEFIGRHVVREAKAYLESLAPPFFRALTHYAEDGSYSWHCPGHSGGVAFLKSPVGRMFHQFFGENMLRADVCNAVEELGQLLDHTGPVAASERNAARIFNADHLFFVTNGTSTSNKIVWHSTVAPGDVVIVDRNCHKSVLHSIIMTGAIPVFLMPTRNHYGIIAVSYTHLDVYKRQCSNCGHEEHIFGEGGGKEMCQDYDTEFLGALPLELSIRELTDSGKPTVVGAPDSRAADIYRTIARRIAVKVAERARDMSAKFPNIVVQNT